jgi:hypothetical protein
MPEYLSPLGNAVPEATRAYRARARNEPLRGTSYLLILAYN